MVHNLQPKGLAENVVPIKAKNIEMKSAVGTEVVPDEQIAYCGKTYTRWRDGKEFRG